MSHYEKPASLRERFNHGILDELTEALLSGNFQERYRSPVLRLEAFVQEDDGHVARSCEPFLLASVRFKLYCRDCGRGSAF